MVNVKNIILKLNLESLARTMLIYLSTFRKIKGSEKSTKRLFLNMINNLNSIYLPSLNTSKSEEIKKLFEKN